MRSSRVLIDKGAVTKNWGVISKAIPGSTKILPMVKANAYGHDGILFTRIVEELGAVGVGVADLGEAVELREKGFQGTILCFGPVKRESCDYAHRLGLILSLHGTEELEFLEKIPPHPANQKLRLHLKIDTGMHRWGFVQSDWQASAEKLLRLPGVTVEGIYTHFAESNVKDSAFSKDQLKKFQEAIRIFQFALGKKLTQHAANSGAIFNYPESHFDWVRPGLSLYGYGCEQTSPESRSLVPALQWRASICQIKKIDSGDTVGYNRAFRATRPMKIGIIGVGYGDGYIRNYSPVGVSYNGKNQPVLGVISMDALAIDLTNAPSARAGEEVVLLGKDPGSPTAWELASATKTIPYEVLTTISTRVPRILHEGDHAIRS